MEKFIARFYPFYAYYNLEHFLVYYLVYIGRPGDNEKIKEYLYHIYCDKKKM